MKFLSASDVVGMISRIEDNLTGYWYSIRQEEGTVEVTFAPSEYCILDVDRHFATTREGDSGIAMLTVINEEYPFDLESWWNQIFEVVKLRRALFSETIKEFPPYIRGHRKHSHDNLKKIRKRYTRLITELDEFEKKYDITVSGLYLGSCHLTVDCTIHVVRHEKPERFDCDLAGDAIMSDSISGAYEEMIEAQIQELAR